MLRRLLLCVMALMALWASPALVAAGAFSASAQQAPPTGAQDGSADWQPDPEEQWLFDLRTARFSLGQGVRGYARGPDRHCIDLGDMIRALDLPVRLNRQLGRAEGWVLDERRTLLIDREQGRVEIASNASRLAPGDIVDTPEGWCVRTELLAQWIGVTLRIDLSNSIILLSSDQQLPFEMAAERRARAARLSARSSAETAQLPRAERPYALWETPSVDVVASAEVRRDAQGASASRLRYELFASGEVAAASFTGRVASDDRGVPDSVRLTLFRADATAQLLGPLRATQVAVGDVAGAMTPIALDSGIGRGGFVTNQPLDQPMAFDRTSFRGDLPAGWEAELYRNGQLLGFARADPSGRYEFLDVELLYGLNQFEITLYGPQGQVRRSFQTVPVGLDSIPGNVWRYWAGVFQNGVDLLPIGTNPGDEDRRGWRGVVAVERGLDTRTSVGLFASTHLWRGQRSTGVELAVRRSIGATLGEVGVGWQAGGGLAGRMVWTGALGRGSFQAESLMLRNGYVSDRVTEQTTGLHSLTINQPLNLGRVVLPAQLDLRYRGFVDGSARAEAQARLSGTFRRISLTGRMIWGRTLLNDRPDGRDDVSLTGLASMRLNGVRLRAEGRLAIAGNTQSSAALSADWRHGDHSDWRAELGYDARGRIARASMGFTRRFSALSLTAEASVHSDGSRLARMTLSFGIGPDPVNGGVRFSRERLAAQGQAMAEVYRDDNADGIRQSNEPLVENVSLTVGTAVAPRPTGANGRAIVEALTPHRAVLIGIDESTLEDPFTRAALPGVMVVPRPGVITRIQLPLVATGEVEGTLRRVDGSGVEGAELELVDGNGVVRSRIRSDFDGFFLFETVPYGRYSVRLAASSAAVLRVSARLGDVVLDRANPRVRLGDVRLTGTESLASPGAPAAAAEQVSGRR